MRWGCRCWLTSRAAGQKHGLPVWPLHRAGAPPHPDPAAEFQGPWLCLQPSLLVSAQDPLSPSPLQGSMVSARLLVSCHWTCPRHMCDEALWIPSLSLAEGCSQPVLSRVRVGASRR